MEEDGATPELRADSAPVMLYGCACDKPIVVSYECLDCERRRMFRDLLRLAAGVAAAFAAFAGGMYLLRQLAGK